MASVLYMLSRAPHWGMSALSTSKHQNTTRNRLQKARPKADSRKSLYSCEGIFDVIRAQSCLSIFTEGGDDIANNSDEEPQNSPQHVGFLLEDRSPSWCSDLKDPLSDSSADNMELRSVRRTRPKTPVFTIGQLERSTLIGQMDQAQLLAEGYQSVLPPRIVTPCIERQVPKRKPKTLRKIKCQLSLRDLIRDQAQDTPQLSPPSTSHSDAETLVGSESTTSSPMRKGFVIAKEKLPRIAFEKAKTGNGNDKRASLALSDFDNDIGICIDLLTNELATVLFRHHPAEMQGRASGLQILLMIEAYETVQQHVRKQLYDAHVMGKKTDHLQSVERILEHWLQVLYSVYDRSQDLGCNHTVQEETPLLEILEEDGCAMRD